MKQQGVLARLGSVVLLIQPLFTFPVFISVLLGAPPLWLSWIIAIIPWPLRLFTTGRLTERTPFDIPILILTAGMVLGVCLSPDHQLSLPFLNSYLACVFLYYSIVNSFRPRLGYWVAIAVAPTVAFLFLFVAVFAGGGARQLVFNSWAAELFASLNWSPETLFHFNVLGGIAAVVIPGLVAIAIFRQRAWLRWSAAALALIFSGILVLSTSGSGWVATMAGLLVVVLCSSPKVMRVALIAFGALAATVPLWYKASWLGTIFYPEAIPGRIERWQVTITALKDSPLTGLGVGGWWSKADAFGMSGGPHNAYLQLYSDAGVLGLIALIIAAVIGVRLFWRILHADKGSPYYGLTLGIVAGFVASGIFALVDDNMSILIPLGNGYLYFAIPLLWLWAALLVLACRNLLGKSDKHKVT